MPIYDYRCTQCGHQVEVIHAIGGSGPETCEVCGGVMRKALSAPAIHFKGSGWAKKDAQTASRSRSTTDAASSDTKGGEAAAAASDKGAGEGTSSEAKSDAKSDGGGPAASKSQPATKAASGTAAD